MSSPVSLKIQRLHPEAKLPSKANAGDAAFDLSTTEAKILQPGERHTFGLGFSAEFPPEYVALIRDRSSLGSRGLHCLAGVIDSSYRGEWKVVMLNTSTEAQSIAAGDRIAQCLILPVPEVHVTEVKELSTTGRGAGGFGSSGQ